MHSLEEPPVPGTDAATPARDARSYQVPSSALPDDMRRGPSRRRPTGGTPRPHDDRRGGATTSYGKLWGVRSPTGSAARAVALLRRELQLAGVSPQNLFPSWARSKTSRDAILQECLVALDTRVHEGVISPYGALILPRGTEIPGEILPLGVRDLEIARKAADGNGALLVWDDDTLRGLLLLDVSRAPDLELTRLARPRRGIAIRRDQAGAVRIYKPQFSLRHTGRRWTVSPTLSDAVERIRRVADRVDQRLLFTLLEFAFYVLSPWQIGATLVWILSDREPAVETADLRPFRLSLAASDGGPSLSFAAHLLAQYDGATIIDRTGRLITTGIHLTPSARAHELLPPSAGTRHTSARRASFDQPDTLVVTVSADGPVSIFSDGVDIFDLWFFSPTRAKTTVVLTAPTVARDHVCPRCAKTLRLDTPETASGAHAEATRCPVCRYPLDASGMRASIRKVF